MIVKSQVKYIQSLGQKKYRDEDAVFVAEGPKLVKELLNADNIIPVNIFGLDEWIKTNDAILDKGQVVEVSESELDRISLFTSPNQVLGIFRKPSFSDLKLEGKISLVLDNIQDPGNLGTIVRTADWFGIEYIICSEDSADVFNPKVVQATMGSIARVQVIYRSLPELLRDHSHIEQYATALEGTDVTLMKPIREGLIIIGNESRGISEEVLRTTTQKITIAKKGKAESLNAAVAAGIVLSHFI